MAVLLALAFVRLLDRALAPDPPDPPETRATIRRPLHKWDLLGCYELRQEAWEFEALKDLPGARRDVQARDTPAQTSVQRPPSRLMLLPDSVDEWGRALNSHRVAPLAGDSDDPIYRRLRWVVRADTLWLVWAHEADRVGIALFERGDSLVGRAVGRAASLSADSLQATAPASAWPINCATLLRERTRERPRR